MATQSAERPDPRPAMRPEPREMTDLERATARAAQLREHLGDMDNEGADKFHINDADIPEGWSYEWKTHTVLNQENPAYQVHLARTGWEPVPLTRHPEFMPKGWKGNQIERDGLVLMQRPLEITHEMENIERRKARRQLRDKEEQLGAAPPQQFQREKSNGETLVKIKKSYEPIPIPE